MNAKLPKSAIQLTEFEQLEEFAKAFSTGELNLMIIVGRPGIAKSETIRSTIKHACWIEGSATAFGMYGELYRHQDSPVCIDDVDDLCSDKASVRLLKSLCQTRQSKTLRWLSNAAVQNGLPTEFETCSSVCIIANEWSNPNENVKALIDRGHLIHFAPVPPQIHAKVGEWFNDNEIYEWFGERLSLFEDLSMRSYVKARELKRAGINWRNAALQSHTSIPGNARILLDLLGNSGFSQESERVDAFKLQTGGSRATYFNLKRRFGNWK